MFMKRLSALLLAAMTLCAALLLVSCDTCEEHEWTEWQTVANATCTLEGSERRTCNLCKENEYQMLPAIGAHDFVDDVCSVCGTLNIVLPMMIEKTAFGEKILQPLTEAKERGDLSSRDHAVFVSYYSLKSRDKGGVAENYPITLKKGIDIYVYNDDRGDMNTMRRVEAILLAHTDYTFEELERDHAFVQYQPQRP